MARYFDNINDDIVITLKSFQTSLSTVSVGVWFNTSNTDHYKRLWQLGPGYPNLHMDLEWNNRTAPPNILRFNARWTGGIGALGEWALPSTGTWHHSLLTYNWGSTANKPEHYLNGSNQTRTDIDTPTGTPVNNSTAFYIGSEASGGQYYGGSMAEIAMWNRILSTSEITILSKGFSPLFVRRGLVMYLPLIGRASSEVELVGESSGTINGATNIAHPRIIYPKYNKCVI